MPRPGSQPKPTRTAALLCGLLLLGGAGCGCVDAAPAAANGAGKQQPPPSLPPGRMRSFVLVNQLDEPLRVVVAYNVSEAVSYAPVGFGELSEVKVESQLLSPTEKATFGLGAAHWGYGARVTAWEVINIYLEAVQGEGTPAAQVQPPQPGTDPVIVPVSFASPFAFVAAAVAADKEQEDPLLMVTTLTQLPPASGAAKGEPPVNVLTLEVVDGDNGETVASSADFMPGLQQQQAQGTGAETKERHPVDPIAPPTPAVAVDPVPAVPAAPATAAVAAPPAPAAGGGGNRRLRGEGR